ncbi:MAG: PhoH family protein [Chlorobi bacterium]|nr:PhoH family protein [Chlorobiota bacterium]
MSEKIIEIHQDQLVDFLGEANSNLNVLKTFYPKIKIISRGNLLKLLGEESEIENLAEKVRLMLDYVDNYHSLDPEVMEKIIMTENGAYRRFLDDEDIIVHGVGGRIIKPRTPNQQRIVRSVQKHDMVFVTGPAGTGKTYVSVAMAVRALKNKEVKRIILTRPAVEAGENLGFLPGDMKEKLDPYMQPLYDALFDMIPSGKLQDLMESNIIQIAPLAFMRGRTLDNAFVILDEAQNTTRSQMKMFLTRMGINAKFIITGDPTQIDLRRGQNSGLFEAMRLLGDIPGVDIIQLSDQDVVRHPLVKRIIDAYKTMEKKPSKPIKDE